MEIIITISIIIASVAIVALVGVLLVTAILTLTAKNRDAANAIDAELAKGYAEEVEADEPLENESAEEAETSDTDANVNN